jgi:hypothetical protein
MLLFSIVGLGVSAGLEHAVVEKMLADNKTASGKKVILCFMGKTPSWCYLYVAMHIRHSIFF